MLIRKLTAIRELLNLIFNQPRIVKTFVAFLIDLGCCIFSVWISYYLRLGDFVSLSENGLNALFYSVIISFPIFIAFDLYKTIFRYSGWPAMLTVSKSIIIYGFLFSIFCNRNGNEADCGWCYPL